MNDESERIAKLSPAKRALLQQRLHARGDSDLKPTRPPIAIIGMGCRFADCTNPQDFWELLDAGRDAVTEVPLGRWDLDLETIRTRFGRDDRAVTSGSFLPDIDKFDAAFFGIAPREAERLDPQQRLLLEVAWEALEYAALAPDKLRGRSVGVFVGMVGQDYKEMLLAQGRETIDGYLTIGTSASVAVGRLSYILGLTGPSIAVDTACSSSLVAVHQACQSLILGECKMAITGGVNLLLTPNHSIDLRQVSALSPSGRCKTFDKDADGYVRAEGCGLVVLKLLDQARADGDHVLAVIRASTVNQDGGGNGLTAPNGTAQTELLRVALRYAGLQPHQISYLEAHGTGTKLGDPIELQAAAAAFGAGRGSDRPLLIGSVKTNIGHAEGAAGIAGLIKIVLAMEHDIIPKHLNIKTLNPFIPWAQLPLKVTVNPTPWPHGPRFAGVSGFGIGGTNAHLIIAAPTESYPELAPARSGELLPLSAKSEKALQVLAGHYVKCLDSDTTFEPSSATSLANLCYTAAVGRCHFPYRAAVLADSHIQLRDNLLEIGQNATTRDVVIGQAHAKPRLVMLFTGQGSHYLGMAKQLYDTQSSFKRTLKRCEVLLADSLEYPLTELMFSTTPSAAMQQVQTRYIQLTLFALETALFDFWHNLGVKPDMVMGHSSGEFAAAYAAGILTLEDGLHLVSRRAELMAELPVAGGMAAVFTNTEAVQRDISGSLLCIAADNGSHQVISGPLDELKKALISFRAKGIQCRSLETSQAFHSSFIEPMLDPFERFAETIETHPSRYPLVFNLTGALMEVGMRLQANDWRRHAREPVQFASGVLSLAEQGCDILLEIGPTAVLGPMALRAWPETTKKMPICITSLHRGTDDERCIREAIAKLYTAGYMVDFAAWHGPWARRVQALPTYPFERQRYWLDSTPLGNQGSINHDSLLGSHHSSASGEETYTQQLNPEQLPWLTEHRVFDIPVVPGSLFACMALSSIGCLPARILSTQLERPLLMDQSREVQLILAPVLNQTKSFGVYSRPNKDSEWQSHAHGSLALEVGSITVPQLPQQPSQQLELLDLDCFYRHGEDRGLSYGASFRNIIVLRTAPEEVWGEFEIAPSPSVQGLSLNPLILDACLRLVFAIEHNFDADLALVPTGWDELILWRSPSARFHCRLQIKERKSAQSTADILAWDSQGRALFSLRGVKITPTTRAKLFMDIQAIQPAWFYEFNWLEKALLADVAKSHLSSALEPDNKLVQANSIRQKSDLWLLGRDQNGITERLALALQEKGQNCLIIDPAFNATSNEDPGYETDLSGAKCWRDVLQKLPGDKVLRGIVDLSFLDTKPTLITSTKTLVQDSQRNVCELSNLIKGVIEIGKLAKDGVWLFTRTAQCVEQEPCGQIAASPLWGMARSIALEHPELKLRRIDLDVTSDEINIILQELLQLDGEDQIAWRGRRRLVARLQRTTNLENCITLPKQGGYQLAANAEKSLFGLHVKSLDLLPIAPNEVHVAVESSGLNFRDLLATLGLYPGDPGPLGGEFTGRILGLGQEVTGFEIGDSVLGLACGTFGNRLNADVRLLTKRPENLGLAAAATIPIAFVTAKLAFKLGRLKFGQRVLIHAASGGVGQAAIQLARACGAEIFATASKPKQAVLSQSGIEHIYDSRSTNFSEQILVDTSGTGVDLVLNSLTGEGFIEASLACLKQSGHFIEIGKRDIWSTESISQKRPDVGYDILAVDTLIKSSPEQVGQALREVVGQLMQNKIKPLPFTCYPLVEAASAMRTMRDARHIGKLVLIIPQWSFLGVRANQTYLITGGLGGIGLELASWLVERGANSIVLNGRRPPTDKAELVITQLRASGAQVQVLLADMSQLEEIDHLFDELETHKHPLRGVFHCAGVLRDGTLMNLNPADFEAVMAAKVLGAWRLHERTQEAELDCFVLFASAAGILGHRGQSNYAAANAMLDQLAQHRRSLGLEATSIDWGAWAEVGMAAEREQLNTTLAASGFSWINPKQGIAALEHILEQGITQIAVIPVNWSRFCSQLKSASPFLEFLTPNSESVSTQEPTLPGDPASPNNQSSTLAVQVAELIQQVMRLPQLPNANEDLFTLGMDSLMSVELVNRLNALQNNGQKLPNSLVADYPTLAGLTEYFKVHNNAATASEGVADLVTSVSSGIEETSIAPGSAWLMAPDLYVRQSRFVKTWEGERINPASLVIGRNTKKTEQPPLFWVFQHQNEHRELSRFLEQRPVYGMRSGYEVADNSEAHVQTLALAYVQEIENLYPDGPLYLGGNCGGAIITLAMAQHFARRGRWVALVVLMEWYFPLQSYSGRVSLIFGEQSKLANPYFRHNRPELTWRRTFADYRVALIPGDHGGYFVEPNIQVLAELLKEQLAEAAQFSPRMLPDHGLNVIISIKDAPVDWIGGSQTSIQIEVKNCSAFVLDEGESSGLMLAVRWTQGNTVIGNDKDGRVPLPALSLDEKAELTLPILIPAQSGLVQLKIVLVEEGTSAPFSGANRTRFGESRAGFGESDVEKAQEWARTPERIDRAQTQLDLQIRLNQSSLLQKIVSILPRPSARRK